MKMSRMSLAFALLPAILAAATEPTPPKPIEASMVAPAYPEQERESRIQGTVVLAVDVGTEGIVTDVKVEKGIAGHPAFGDAAVRAVRQWRFEPARLDGKPVSMTIKVPVKFALS